MLITGVRLVDGLREMLIHPRDGIAPHSLDAGSPQVREVSEDRTDDDGTRDSTVLFGPRAVSLEVQVYEDPARITDILDELKSFLHPRSRPYLYVTRDGWAQERRIRLRVDQFSEPYAGYISSLQQTVQAQWKAPDGIWESADLVTETINADIAATVGLDWPITFPISFEPTSASGAGVVENAGGVPAHFVARLYGPCTGPELTNETTGETIRFRGGDTGLIIAAGDYVEINTRDRTAYLLSLTDASRLSYVDYTVTSWWRIEPGENLIRYHPSDSAGPGSAAVIEYRPAWL